MTSLQDTRMLYSGVEPLMKPLFALLCSWSSIPQLLLLPQILDLLLINISITCETERMINELEIGPNEITCDPILY